MRSEPIRLFEYDSIRYGDGHFKERHFKALSAYYGSGKSVPFFSLINRGIRFNNYVGVLKVGDLTIEVLPKCDRYSEQKEVWQKVLFEMLKTSLNVEALTTTHADVNIRQHDVLETYLHLFMDEVQNLMHRGLVKKYRFTEDNQTALKGKLLIQKQITKNVTHAERFFVSHQVYDRDNRYNAILRQTLECIRAAQVSIGTTKRSESQLAFFPECRPVMVSEKLFSGISYDRKIEGYRTAIELARMILLHYHPDVTGGHNNVLAIMFDMNKLWENYIFHTLRKASKDHTFKGIIRSVRAQRSKYFWQHQEGWRFTLNPDITIELSDNSAVVLDTKWKYDKDISIQDIRQMYAYGHYFKATRNYLIYPGRENTAISLKNGVFLDPEHCEQESDMSCGLLYVDILAKASQGKQNTVLNPSLGIEVLKGIVNRGSL